jgi:hypothetical protein
MKTSTGENKRLLKETMTMFTAKLKVNSVKSFGRDNVEIHMTPVMGENDFTKFTPSGNLTFICCNPAVNEQIDPEKVFIVTFKSEAEVAAEQENKADSEG